MGRQPDGSVSFSREDLYALVWRTPLREIARSIGIRPEYISSACDKYQVPRPSNGHWSKCRAGHTPPSPPLPEVDAKDLRTVVIYPSGFRSPRGEEDEGEGAVGPVLAVPDELESPHPLVRKTMAALRKAKGEPTAFVSYPEGAIDVSVSAGSLDRAMRILDTLIKAIEDRSWSAEVREEGREPGFVCLVGNEEIPLKLEEKVRREERSPTPKEQRDAERFPQWYGGPWYKRVATGQLALFFDISIRDGVRRRWSDGKRQRLEELLPKVMDALPRYAALVREQRLIREEWNRQYAEEKRLRAEREAREREERARVDRLLAEVTAWHQAEQIRAYVENVQRRVRQAHGANVSERFGEWVSWALWQADRMDPLIQEDR